MRLRSRWGDRMKGLHCWSSGLGHYMEFRAGQIRSLRVLIWMYLAGVTARRELGVLHFVWNGDESSTFEIDLRAKNQLDTLQAFIQGPWATCDLILHVAALYVPLQHSIPRT
jgi:hypothetical protein